MNILFLSVYGIRNSDSGYIYADLAREFARHGHNVFAVTPTQGKQESFIDQNGVRIICVNNGQIQKIGKIRKVINLLTLEHNTIKTVKKNAKNVKFDLIINLCSSLCFTKTAAYFKKRDKAINYLLLKDIFPQNAVDIGMMRTAGLMGLVYRYFRNKEKKLYRNANYIGCMSEANKRYLVEHNTELAETNVTIVPNSIEPINMSLTKEERNAMREKYGIPQDKTVFVYGGNLGKPQDIPFIIECLKTQKENDAAYFLIAGDGTEFDKLQLYIDTEKPQNVKLLKRLPREDFDSMLAACDVGLIFLDHRFTIPNYPSRLLSYMQAGIPVLACTDRNTDIGKDIVDNEFGWWCESNDINGFAECVREICNGYSEGKGKKANEYLHKYFTVLDGYRTIMNTIENS